MRINTLLISAMLFVGILSSAAQADTLRMLFIGNSYTICNGNDKEPELAVKLAKMAALNGKTIIWDAACSGGKNLQWHWENGGKEAIERGQYDYVVLQDQSAGTVEAPEDFMKYSEKFGEVIKASGGTPMFYMTMAYANRQSMIDTVAMMYNKAAAATKGKVAPCGLAWKMAYEKYPSIKLHVEDNSHASIAGIYLNVYTFYQTIFGEQPRVQYRFPLWTVDDKETFAFLEHCSVRVIKAVK